MGDGFYGWAIKTWFWRHGFKNYTVNYFNGNIEIWFTSWRNIWEMFLSKYIILKYLKLLSLKINKWQEINVF